MRASHIGPQVGILKAMKVMEPRNGKSLEMGNWNNKIVFEYPSDPSDFDPWKFWILDSDLLLEAESSPGNTVSGRSVKTFLSCAAESYPLSWWMQSGAP